MKDIFLTTEKRLNESQAIANMGSWYFDFNEGNIYWTDGMFNIFDINKEHGEPTFEQQYKSIHHDDADLWKKSILELKESAKEFFISFKAYKGKDKQIVYIEMTGKPVFDKDKLVGGHGICQDVTQRVLNERKTAQEQARLIQSSKLSMLSEMAGGISHEINNPLAIISGYSHWLESQYAKKADIDNDKALDIVRKINDSVDRMTDIIKSLRTFSRNASEDPFEESNLNIIISEVLIFIKQRFSNYNIIFENNIEDDLFLECRRTQLSQMIFSLLTNAFEAVTKIDKNNRKITLNAYKKSKSIVLEFIDSGPGVSKVIQDKIMQPFFTTKELGNGTGLGLSISKGVVEDHGGSITLSEDLPTKFTVTLAIEQS